jgi:hypothetical protein
LRKTAVAPAVATIHAKMPIRSRQFFLRGGGGA